MADEMDYMEQAKELADSYRLLVHRRDMLRQQYEDSRSWFYTKDEIIYKLSQGAHEESERVQTSGTSNPVERTVLNCDKVLASMNREVQTQRTEQFLEPYYKDCAVFGGVPGSWQSSSLWTAESSRRSLVWMGEL